MSSSSTLKHLDEKFPSCINTFHWSFGCSGFDGKYFNINIHKRFNLTQIVGNNEEEKKYKRTFDMTCVVQDTVECIFCLILLPADWKCPEQSDGKSLNCTCAVSGPLLMRKSCAYKKHFRPGNFGCIDSAHHKHLVLHLAECLATVAAA